MPITREAFRFFSRHGGTIVGENAKCAVALARAEAWAEEQELQAIWQDDDHGPEFWTDDARTIREYQEGYTTVEWCRLVRPCPEHGADCPHAETLGSLGSVHLSANSDPYRRVVEAELALEAMG